MCSYCDHDDGHDIEHCHERPEDKFGTGTAELREGETRDDDNSHAGDIVARQLAEADDETRDELEDREVRTDGGTVEDWHGTEAPASVDGVDLLEADACPACESTGTFFEGPAGYFTCDRCHSTWAGDAGDAEIVTYLEWTENKKLVTDGGTDTAWKVRASYKDERGNKRTLETVGAFQERQAAEDYRFSLEYADTRFERTGVTYADPHERNTECVVCGVDLTDPKNSGDPDVNGDWVCAREHCRAVHDVPMTVERTVTRSETESENEIRTDGGTRTQQARLPVGDTRKPIVLKNARRVTTGDLSTLAMCAHRFEPADVMGWYTHEYDDVLREWICSNVGSVIAQLSPHCEDTRGDLSPLHPADDLWTGSLSDGPTQATLEDTEGSQ